METKLLRIPQKDATIVKLGITAGVELRDLVVVSGSTAMKGCFHQKQAANLAKEDFTVEGAHHLLLAQGTLSMLLKVNLVYLPVLNVKHIRLLWARLDPQYQKNVSAMKDTNLKMP
jgi:hypothetical protein